MKGKFAQTSKLLKCIERDCMSLSTAPINKNSHFFAWNLLYLSKKHPRTNLTGFKYQIWTSVKRFEK